MPRKKKEATEESAIAVKRRYVRKNSEAGGSNEVGQPHEAEAEKNNSNIFGQETPPKKRTYVKRKKNEADSEDNVMADNAAAQVSRRGRRKKTAEEAAQTTLPFERQDQAAPPAREKHEENINGSLKNQEESVAVSKSAPADAGNYGANTEYAESPGRVLLNGTENSEAAVLSETVFDGLDGTPPEDMLSNFAANEAELPLQYDIHENEREQQKHEHPKLTFNQLDSQTLAELRKIAKKIGVASVTTHRKDDLINDILKTQSEALGYRFNGGTLECTDEGYGFLRPSGLLPSNSDIYVSASQIRRFGLRNGDVVWGVIRPPKDQEHYEALLRVENVNFTDPEKARHRPNFETLTPIFPTEKLRLETDRRQLATRIVDIFAPIGKGQRALIVSPPKAGKTTLLKNIAHSITTNHPEVILMVLLIDERPEEVTDMARSVDGEIIASTFDRPADEHLRVAKLALEKAKRLVEASKDVVLLLDSITRLARASNLIVPPSGRTLSGGMDPAALYFPKKFFGAARNIENGGSLTIIGTSLVETGSRMDDVIYEEFKGTGNMEVHLSRKISELRIFPALDITRSGTRKEELMVPEEDLKRIWALRRKIANMDEAEVLNLILEKLRITPTNRDFLATIKVG